MPEKGTMLKLKNYNRSEKVPFIVYADFESYIKPLHLCDPNPESSYTKQYQRHEPSSIKPLHLCDPNPESSYTKQYQRHEPFVTSSNASMIRYMNQN